MSSCFCVGIYMWGQQLSRSWSYRQQATQPGRWEWMILCKSSTYNFDIVILFVHFNFKCQDSVIELLHGKKFVFTENMQEENAKMPIYPIPNMVYRVLI